MHIIDEMFMFLVRIMLGLFVHDFAFWFQLQISTVSRKLTTWVNYLYFLLGPQGKRLRLACHMSLGSFTLVPGSY